MCAGCVPKLRFLTSIFPVPDLAKISAFSKKSSAGKRKTPVGMAGVFSADPSKNRLFL